MSGYWSSPAARQRLRAQRRRAAAHAQVEQEPRSKGRAGRRDAIEFRQAVRDGLAGHRGWPKPRASLAVDLRFATKNRQPPSLARLPKNYLDLLSATNAPTQDPGPVLYNDDGAISMLYASASNLWTPGQPPSTRGLVQVSARTRTDALADLALTFELSNGEGPPFEPAHQPLIAEDWERDDARDTIRLLRQRDDSRSRHTAELMEHYERREGQRSYLQSRDAALAAVMLNDGHRLLTGSDPTERAPRRSVAAAQTSSSIDTKFLDLWASAGYRNTVLSSTGPVELPPLPTAAGDSEDFHRDLDTTLADFARRHPGLIPLVEPLRITVLVIPPARGEKTAKDLDNILIDLLGSVDQHFKPPAEPYLVGPYDDDDAQVLGQRLADWRQTGVARLKSLGDTAIWAYQVLELQRHRDDPPAGKLLLILGHGMNMRSIWDEAATYLDDYFRSR